MLRVGVDVGGTFTDVLLVDDDGRVTAVKVPTTPREPQRAVRDALAASISSGAGVSWLGHATTIATNALLGQIGLELPRVALVTTHGFRDLIEIGRQNRSRVYDLFVERPKALIAREDRLTVKERIGASGTVVEPLDDASLDTACETIRSRGIGAVAVCLLNSYANDTHERSVVQRIRERCGGFVVSSSAVDPEYREYERFSTTVVTAALAPIISAYIAALEKTLRELGITTRLHVMRSDGGLSDAASAAARPASLIESGPASGVIAAASLARAHGIAHALSFDMGGTTAKAGSVVDGLPETAAEYEAAGATHSGRAIGGSGYTVRVPFIDLSEVSAGGGTIAWVDEAGSLRVGPVSAGADPGPACYGRSNDATVTDANVVLGRLHQTYLLGGTFPIDAQRSRDAVGALASRLALSVEETAAGILRIVDAQMAKVLRIVTVERGLDPRDFTMIAFGGNGPLHACELAGELGVACVLIPDRPGLFSAYGLLVAELSTVTLHPVLRETRDATHADLERIFAELEERGRAALREQGAQDGTVTCRRTYDARYRGQSFELQLEHADSIDAIERRFHALHRARYGYAVDDEAIELVNARSTVTAARSRERERRADGHARETHPERNGERRVFIDGERVGVPLYAREDLAAGVAIDGPAIVEQYDCTTYVDRGWNARVLADGVLSLERVR